MSKHRLSPKRGWARKLPQGPNGRNLCRECQTEVPKGRQTFCSNGCVEKWKVRSDPTFVRIKLYERDKGVCAICGADCVALVKELEKIEGPVDYWTKKSYAYAGLIIRNKILSARLEELAIPLHRYERRRRYGIWDADHITPVVEGGGECGLDGYRTLCCRCHRDETTKLKRRLAEQKKREQGKPISYKLFE